MRYNDRNVVTAVNVYRVIGYTEPHAVRYYAKRHGIEYWTLSGRTLDDFKDSNGFRSSCNRLTVYDADGFTGLQRNKPMKEEEVPMKSKDNNVRNQRMAQEISALCYENKEFGALRGVNVEGSPWFVGKDVAKALGYEHVPSALQDHVDSDDKTLLKRSNGKAFLQKWQNATFRNPLGQGDESQGFQNGTFEISLESLGFTVPPRGLTVINESGMYSLILSSKLPSAKRFKHWITSEVLPSIRKTGGYGADSIERKVDALAISMSALWLYLSTRDAMAAGFSREIAKYEVK